MADITYIRTREAFLYLAPDYRPLVAQDRGLSFGRNAGDGQVLRALAMALKGLKDGAAAHPPLGPGMPVCLPRLRAGGAEGGLDNEHDRDRITARRMLWPSESTGS